MSQTEDIRVILFLKAKELKTTDSLILAEIDAEIELTKSIVPTGLGDNYNLGVALMVAHNLTMQKQQSSGYAGSISSVEIDGEKISYSNAFKNSKDDLSGTSYIEQYNYLLKLLSNTTTPPLKNIKTFKGFVI